MPSASTADRVGSALAMLMLAAMAGHMASEHNGVDAEQTTAAGLASGTPTGPRAGDVAARETMVAGYFGAPFTYPSNISIINPRERTVLSLEKAAWDGKPFKSPIYYGVRVARWGRQAGWMVDFTHSKTITRPDEETVMKGIIDGAAAPAKAKVGAIFKHLEFSHGHNMLTFNGLWRLFPLGTRLSPYVGAGGGAALPHTEVQLMNEPKRTYEYQFAGPVVQALVGLEIRLPTTTLFFEYKFTFADYVVPLSRLEGNLLFTDIWRQAQLWWTGQQPPGGYLVTTLASHQVIGGAGVRF